MGFRLFGDGGNHLGQHCGMLRTEIMIFTDVFLDVEEFPLLPVAHGLPFVHQDSDVGKPVAMANRVKNFSGAGVSAGEDVIHDGFAIEVLPGRDPAPANCANVG